MWNNLRFFKGLTSELQFNQVNGIWEGSIYLPVVSTQLYETVNLFILEECVDSNGNPVINTPVSPDGTINNLDFSWEPTKVDDSEDIIMYGYTLTDGKPIVKELKTQTKDLADNSIIISQDSNYLKTISDNTNVAIQINIALNSTVEGIHKRVLQIKAGGNVIARIQVYGEVEGEDERLKVLLVSFTIILFFWAAFEQAGGLMNIYTFEKTKRTIEVLNNWEVPASWFQSINPLLIIILGVFISNFWINRKKLNKESSSLFKMLIGLIIMGSGFIFMTFASLEYQNNLNNTGDGYSSMYWLVLAYLFITIGELCASPVILSFITKLSPERFLSTIMGAYFASVGIGNMLAAKIGQSSSKYGETHVFLGICIFCVSFAFLILFYLKKQNRMTNHKDEI